MKYFKTFRDDDTGRTTKVFISEKAAKKRRYDLRDNPMELPLCAICARPFFESPWHRIYRMDPCQMVLDTCARCQVRPGYDYRVFDYRKPAVKKEDIYVIA